MLDLTFGKPRLVGLCGPLRAGKSTLASEMRDAWGYKILPFADPLKKMLRVFGLSYAQVSGAEKNDKLELLCGQTPRHAMQTLGTEWGRKCIGEDVWCNAWEFAASEISYHTKLIVADDVRFVNEAQRIRDLGGIIVRVVRDLEQLEDNLSVHDSERHMLIDADFHVFNNGTREDLVRAFSVGVDQLEAAMTEQENA